MRRILAFAMLAMGIACLGEVRATTTVQVIATDPPGENVTLARNQDFYVHLRYHSDRPVRIWAHPFFLGAPAEAGSNPSPEYPAGSGEALGWFFLINAAAQVDEVRISASDGSLDRTPVVATYRVQISGGDQTAATGVQPEWVTRLRARAQAAQRATTKSG
jgi:hypothetical protein